MSRRTIGQRLFLALQYLLPHHLVSAVVHAATRWRFRPWKNALIRTLARRFDMDLSEAESADPEYYASFNAFFTRALKEEARPVDPDPRTVVCPADGTVSQAGAIQTGRVLQAKGRWYTVEELLGGDADEAERYRDGRFATIYLSPRDYHRVHMPLAGALRQSCYVPGRLFSVAPLTTETIPRLFARNERIICHFDGRNGPFAQILVGAINVSAMETVWQGEIPGGRRIRVEDHATDAIALDKGEEMGRFNMGSTVILLFPAGTMKWDDSLIPGARVRMGQRIGALEREPA